MNNEFDSHKRHRVAQKLQYFADTRSIEAFDNFHIDFDRLEVQNRFALRCSPPLVIPHR
jgi:hypothetical protein